LACQAAAWGHGQHYADNEDFLLPSIEPYANNGTGKPLALQNRALTELNCFFGYTKFNNG
jgi:hypothetical protein